MWSFRCRTVRRRPPVFSSRDLVILNLCTLFRLESSGSAVVAEASTQVSVVGPTVLAEASGGTPLIAGDVAAGPEVGTSVGTSEAGMSVGTSEVDPARGSGTVTPVPSVGVYFLYFFISIVP